MSPSAANEAFLAHALKIHVTFQIKGTSQSIVSAQRRVHLVTIFSFSGTLYKALKLIELKFTVIFS